MPASGFNNDTLIDALDVADAGQLPCEILPRLISTSFRASWERRRTSKSELKSSLRFLSIVLCSARSCAVHLRRFTLPLAALVLATGALCGAAPFEAFTAAGTPAGRAAVPARPCDAGLAVVAGDGSLSLLVLPPATATGTVPPAAFKPPKRSTLA